jgi:histone-lysine N-methyltransferase SETMAR
MDFDNIEQRAVIKFLTLEKKGPKEIHERLVGVYGDSALSDKTVKKWSKLFKWGRLSLEDDHRSGRPNEAVTPDTIKKVEELVMSDRRFKCQKLADKVGISKTSVLKILHQHLGMSKISSRWVPRMLTPEMKKNRLECSDLNLTLMRQDPNFFSRVVTGDETWVHHYDPETKQESMQWTHQGSPPPKKFKVQKSAGKIMATVFWDIEGILLIEYMPHKTTITGASYATIESLRQAFLEKRRGKLARGILLLQDNASSHTSRVATAAVEKAGFGQLDHPPYSPDLAPSDYFLFGPLKKFLRGRHFSDDEEVKLIFRHPR